MASEDNFEIITPFPLHSFLDDVERHILSPLSCLRDFGTHWILEFDLPLVKKKDIKVSLDGNQITIEARLHETYSEEQLGKHTEFQYFKKTLTLPQNVDTKRISAKFDNGRLAVIIPKTKTGHRIKVQ